MSPVYGRRGSGRSFGAPECGRRVCAGNSCFYAYLSTSPSLMLRQRFISCLQCSSIAASLSKKTIWSRLLLKERIWSQGGGNKELKCIWSPYTTVIAVDTLQTKPPKLFCWNVLNRLMLIWGIIPLKQDGQLLSRW